MKLLHVITTLVFGGAEKLLTSYLNLQTDDHEVHLVYFKGEPKLLPVLNDKVIVHKIDLGISSVMNLRKLIKDLAPDVVHSHLGHADLITMAACYKLKIKYFITLHNVFFKKDFRDEVYYLAYRILLNYSVPQAKLISVGHAVQDNLAKAKLKMPSQRLLLRYNAIASIDPNLDKVRLREELNIKKESFVLLFVGRLAKQKSVHTLIEVLPYIKDSIPSVKCLILGEGDQLESLKDLTIKLELSEIVEFRGSSLKPEEYYSSADLFVLPSIFEGLVTVVIEAFRSRLPVVISNVDGNTELVENLKNGLLFQVGNPQDLSEKILKLHSDKQLRKEISENGYLIYKNNFDINVYNNWLMAQYIN